MNKQQYYNRVREFRNAFGLHGQSIELHRALWAEEQYELFRAATDAEVADALVDSLFIWLGCKIDTGLSVYRYEEWFWAWIEDQCRATGVYLPGAFNLVYKSNMSKLCTDAEIQPTIDKYLALGVEVTFHPTESGLWACYSDSDHPYHPRGKLLKSVGFREPDWTQEGWRV